MGDIVVCGGGVIGLAAAAMLVRDGHRVTVLEADPAEVPATAGAAWESWQRKGVAQFRQPHNLFPGFRRVCDAELPEVTGRLLAAGCVWEDPVAVLPPSLTDHDPRPGDETLAFATGRRPAIEYTIASLAAEQPGLEVRRGVRVTGLTRGPDAIAGVPHVTGVVTSEGDEIGADLVVDATGRRTAMADLLAALGARRPQTESEDCGFAYYTRYFSGPALPARIGPPILPIGTITLLTLPGDSGTWSVTVFAAGGDAPLKELRHVDTFSRVVRACPLQAHWLDGEPVTDVLPIAGIMDCYRRFVVDGEPIATGFAAVGDAWACTNPSAGRGISVGALHAQLLRQTVRDRLGDPAGFARAWDERTEAMLAPHYRNQISADRIRLAQMDALRAGREPPPDDSFAAGLLAAANTDPDAFRAFLEIAFCLALPDEVRERPGMREKAERARHEPQQPAPGPDRRQLLRLLAQ